MKLSFKDIIMKSTWGKKTNGIRELVDVLLTFYKINDKEQVSWTLGGEIYLNTLYRRLENKPDISDKTLYSLFERAFREAYAKDQKIRDYSSILELFQLEYEKLLSKHQKFKLITKISIKNPIPLKRRVIDGCNLAFKKQLPKKFQKHRSNLIFEIFSEDDDKEVDWTYVIISTSSTDNRTAYEKATNALNIYRALLELSFTNNSNFLAQDEEIKYPSKSGIRLGNYHSLHNESGSVACKLIWFERGLHTSPPITLKEPNKVELILQNHLRLIKQSSLKFNAHLKKSLKLYIAAIDMVEPEQRFLKLWTAMEVLLVNCDKEVALSERISFRYSNRSTVKLLLSELRRERNDNIHKGMPIVNIEYKSFILKDFFEDMMRFFIKNRFNFTSAQHVVDFMHLPTKIEDVNDSIRRLKLVKKYIGA